MNKKQFKAEYVSEFCMEIYLIIRAGIPFSEGISLLLKEETDSRKNKFLNKIYQELENGESLAVACKKAEELPHYAVEMIAIGQKTGYLEKVFYALAQYYERLAQVKQSIHNIIWYPLILLVMMLFVILVLLIKVMPIFSDIFSQLGATFSPAAQVLLQIGLFLERYGVGILLAVIVFCVLTCFLWKKTTLFAKGRTVLSRMLAKGKLNRLMVSSKLADALVLTLSSGISVDEALDLAGNLVQDEALQPRIVQCKKAMLVDGKSFADACMENEIFAAAYCRMIAVGFHTGNMDLVMQEVARRLAEDVDKAFDDLLNRIEPAIIILLSVLVGIILLSVMLPLMGIMTAIG